MLSNLSTIFIFSTYKYKTLNDQIKLQVEVLQGKKWNAVLAMLLSCNYNAKRNKTSGDEFACNLHLTNVCIKSLTLPLFVFDVTLESDAYVRIGEVMFFI